MIPGPALVTTRSQHRSQSLMLSTKPVTVSRPPERSASRSSRRLSAVLRPRTTTTWTSVNRRRIAAARRAMPPLPSPPPVSKTTSLPSASPSDRRRRACWAADSGPRPNSRLTGGPATAQAPRAGFPRREGRV